MVTCIQKLKLTLGDNASIVNDTSYFTSWIDAAIRRKIQHLDLEWPEYGYFTHSRLRLHSCETLVFLRLFKVFLDDAVFVVLPCLKTMYLEQNWYPSEATLKKLISSCPVLESLKIVSSNIDAQVYRVHSRSLKNLNIERRTLKVFNGVSGIVIDAPLLCSLSIDDDESKSFIVNNFESNAKLNISLNYGLVGSDIRTNVSSRSSIGDFLSGISRIGDMTISQSTFQGELFPFISATGNNDVIFNQEFVREDEKKDERISRVVALITAKQDWSEFVWEVEALPRHGELSDSEEDGENVGVEVEHVTDTHVDEAPVVARMGKRLVNDPGVESRKKQLLCQRAAEHNSGISSEVKTFIEGLFTSAFNSFKEVVQKDIHHRFDKVEKEMAQLNQVVSQIRGPSEMVGKERASVIPCPSSSIGKDQEKSSQSPSAAKKKGKDKVDEVVVPPIARRSPRQARKELETDDMMDFLNKLSQRSNTHGEPPSKNEEMGTQEDLLDAMGNLSQASYVDGFDPSQKISGEEAAEWVTPLRSFKPAGWKTPTLKDIELPEDRMNDVDYSLVFLPEDLWAKLIEWCSTSKQQLRIGPSIFNKELAERVMGPSMWLKNYEIDAMLYLFREKTTLQRWNQSKVAFMSCLFSNQMKNAYKVFKNDIKKFMVEGLLHQYGMGELPAHGRT
ncbi:hypothetical protein Bca52824_035728 [Brassica carinata]|uniref:F-box/LRR-repeat protein 15/At3g58940/PEG3-like LRR domain-containing protein n=1 Tax=Brassica carinata TaxID=52824 RepID=A0A8X7V4C6_BRACI|nr:hypothetical protein Bca52824_035728 [Brassica carinata]